MVNLNQPFVDLVHQHFYSVMLCQITYAHYTGGSVATWTCIIVVVGVAVVIPIFCTRAGDSGFCSKIPQIFPSNGKPGEGTLDNGKVSPSKRMTSGDETRDTLKTSNEYGNSKGMCILYVLYMCVHSTP